MIGWPDHKIHWTDRLSAAGFAVAGEYAQYLIIDEGQSSYWDQEFFVNFVKPLGPSWHPRVVIFVGYGSVTNQLEFERGPSSTYFSTTPIIIPHCQRITLRPSDDNVLGLLLGQQEFEEMFQKFHPPIQLNDELLGSIYQVTAGHVGAINDLFTLISRHEVRPYCP